MRAREGYFGVYFPSCLNSSERISNPSRGYIRHFISLHDIITLNMTIKRQSSHIDSVSRSPCLSSAGDVTINCWWHHNDPTIVIRARVKSYLTRWISILFTAGRVRNVTIIQIYNSVINIWSMLTENTKGWAMTVGPVQVTDCFFSLFGFGCIIENKDTCKQKSRVLQLRAAYCCRFRRSVCLYSWWRQPMETFSAVLPVTGEFPSQRPLWRSFDVFFDLRLNKRSSKQSRRLWFKTPSRSL